MRSAGESNSAECAAWMLLDLTSPQDQEKKQLRKDMVNVAYDTLSKEVQWMLTNVEGSKALVYVTQPYMNLDNASLLRDDIDVMLAEPMEEQGIRVSPLTGGLPVSLDINEGIHETQKLHNSIDTSNFDNRSVSFSDHSGLGF